MLPKRTFIDKTTWPRGEWDNEPDFLQDIEKETGYTYFISRIDLGNLCGYVILPKNHIVFENHYDDEIFQDIDVHGGLTYSEHDHRDIEANEENPLWILGFDCAHSGDLMPGSPYLQIVPEYEKRFGRNYRNLDYVIKECKSLAKQLYELDKNMKGKKND
jgi:hypothetical protein